MVIKIICSIILAVVLLAVGLAVGAGMQRNLMWGACSDQGYYILNKVDEAGAGGRALMCASVTPEDLTEILEGGSHATQYIEL